ncbi:hypothetical protein HOT29_gp096 [Microbacterium phage Squash]|uniref:Uncharacterized protein n=1 Tax=Microbacterium phage Squash TaxID=2182357 RepID=A0A2U8ULT4_9CAUD|nr:hypothetical protein HOT29_gp096 [Microbacterium phage Squash]AWN04714.1 hypothetical protein PBI_SQUASH_96 [Microbacterium phage Squash]
MGKKARIKAQRGEFVRGQKHSTGALSAKEARRKEREQDELIARLAASVANRG